jgi:hypothetical protein
MHISLNSFRILFTATVFTFLMSCEKDDNTPAPKTEAQLIGSGMAWKFSKATSGGVDVSSLVEVCMKDNLITMNDASPTKTGNVNEGATKCNASDPQQVDFTWTYDGSTKLMTISSTGGVRILPGGSNVFTLVSVTETQMVLSQNITFMGSTQLAQATFIH